MPEPSQAQAQAVKDYFTQSRLQAIVSLSRERNPAVPALRDYINRRSAAIAGAVLAAGATPAPAEAGWGTFSAQSPPGASWRPLGPQSPFNNPIPQSPTVHPNSSAIVSKLLADSYRKGALPLAGTAGTPEDYMQPVYWSKTSDPEYVMRFVRSSSNPWENWTDPHPWEGQRVRIPNGAKPAGGFYPPGSMLDSHMTVVEQETGEATDFWRVKSMADGVITASWAGGTKDIRSGDGVVPLSGMALEVPVLAGMIRLPELAAGEINHALRMNVYCVDWGFVYPASSDKARKCSQAGGSNTNAPKLGMRFQLQYSDAQIQAAHSSIRPVLKALATYGAFVSDTTDDRRFLFPVESAASYVSFGMADPYVAYAKANAVAGWYWSEIGREVFDFKAMQAVDWTKLRVINP